MKVTISIDIDSAEELETARSMVGTLQQLVQDLQRVQPPSAYTAVENNVQTTVNTIKVQGEVSGDKQQQQQQQQLVQQQQQQQQYQQEGGKARSQRAEVDGSLQPPHHSPPSYNSQSQNHNVRSNQSLPQAQPVQDEETLELKNVLLGQMNKVLNSGLSTDQMSKAVQWVADQDNASVELVSDVYFEVVQELCIAGGDANKQQIYIQLLNQLSSELKAGIKAKFVRQSCQNLLQSPKDVNKVLAFQYCAALTFMHQEGLLDSKQASGVAFRLLQGGSYIQGIMLFCKLIEQSKDRLLAESPEEMKRMQQFLIDNKNKCLQDQQYELEYLANSMDWDLQ